MSAPSMAEKVLAEAASLGLLASIAEVMKAIVRGKPSEAERLAKNAALAAASKIAARERIARVRGK